ncbi:putative IS256 family transposase [Octadecabacter arcticus 238]|uniref:Mutator family transposase n=1 Tax=Octadecabacter arcticus 238 TaxID=391616 RepID=M9RQH9_9RHOB|nr:putative IS256 family transposase [Octadecabacter arcticus 238]
MAAYLVDLLLEAALPWLYLKGISSGEMGAALKVLLGPDAAGLSANTVSRLKRDWAKEYDGWREAVLEDEPLVYIWADGVHSGLRGEDDKLCALVIVGVTARGKKRFLAIEDGVRESTQSWREVLLSLKSRGMNAPKLAIRDGAMGFWAAMDEVYPTTRHQRCWQHKTMNVLNCLPKQRETDMSKGIRFTDEFKRDAVAQVVERAQSSDQDKTSWNAVVRCPRCTLWCSGARPDTNPRTWTVPVPQVGWRMRNSTRRSCGPFVPECLLPFQRTDRTIKPWDQILRSIEKLNRNGSTGCLKWQSDVCSAIGMPAPLLAR